MTDPEIDVDAPEDKSAMSKEKAAEVVENDPALQKAGADDPSSPSSSEDS